MTSGASSSPDPAEGAHRLLERLDAMPAEARAFALDGLAESLARSSHPERLAALLTAFPYLQAKLDAHGPEALIAEFELCLSLSPSTEIARALGSCKQALTLSAPVLGDDPSQLASQLLGRLGADDADIKRELSAQVAASSRDMWLLPLSTGLESVGGALEATQPRPRGSGPVALTQDGRLAAVARGGVLQILELESRQPLHEIHMTPAESLLISPSQNEVLCVTSPMYTRDGGTEVCIWGLRDGDERRRFAPPAKAIHVSPDWTFLVTAAGTTLTIWDFETLVERRQFVSPGRVRYSGAGRSWSDERAGPIAISPDGNIIAVAMGKHGINLFDAASGELLRTLTGRWRVVSELVITSDGTTVIGAAPGTGRICSWDLNSGEQREVLAAKDVRAPATVLASSPNGGWLAMGTNGGELVAWPPDRASAMRLNAHDNRIEGLAVGDDGRAVTTSTDGTLRIWNLARAGARASEDRWHSATVSGACVTGDGRFGVTVTEDGLRMWDMEDGGFVSAVAGHGSWTSGVARMGGETKVATYGDEGGDRSPEGTVRIWDAASGRELSRLSGSSVRSLEALALDLDCTTAVTTYHIDDFQDHYHGVELWDLQKPAIRIEGRDDAGGFFSRSIAFAPDGRRVLAAEGSSINLHVVESLRTVASFAGHEHDVTDIATASERAIAASCDGGGVVKTWSTEDCHEVTSFPAMETGTTAMSIDAVGRTAVVIGRDRSVVLCDLEQGRPTARFTADSRLNACALSPSGDRVVVGDELGRVHVLQVMPPAEGNRVPARPAAVAPSIAPPAPPGPPWRELASGDTDDFDALALRFDARFADRDSTADALRAVGDAVAELRGTGSPELGPALACQAWLLGERDEPETDTVIEDAVRSLWGRGDCMALLVESLHALVSRQYEHGTAGASLPLVDDAIALHQRITGDNAPKLLYARALCLGSVGEPGRAVAVLEDSIAALRERGRRAAEAELAFHLAARAHWLDEAGDVASATAAADEAIATFRRLIRSRKAVLRRDLEQSRELDPGHEADSELAESLLSRAARHWREGQERQAAEEADGAAALYDRLASARPVGHAFDRAIAALRQLGCERDPIAATRRALEAHELYEGATSGRLDELLDALAGVFHGQAERLQGEPALAAANEAVRVLRRLAAVRPDFRLPLARTLELAFHLSSQIGSDDDAEPGFHSQALIREAVDIYRALDESRPGAHRGDLASALMHHAAWRADRGGMSPDALDAAREGVALLRELEQERPHDFAYQLADALVVAGITAWDFRDARAAVSAMAEAIERFRALVEPGNADAAPALARAMFHQARYLEEVSYSDAVLDVSAEAVALFRRLADGPDEDMLEWFAAASSRHADLLLHRGRIPDAVAYLREATAAYRRLVAHDPERLLPELAASLDTETAVLERLGHIEEAIAAGGDAVTVHTRIVSGELASRLPYPRGEQAIADLARAWTLQGHRLARRERLADAVLATDESVGAWRRLHAITPEAALAGLADALHDRATWLLSSGADPHRALPDLDEAATMHRWLVDNRPWIGSGVPSPSYVRAADVLRDQAACLVAIGQDEQAAEALEEAIHRLALLLYRSPYEELPDAKALLAEYRAVCRRLRREPDPVRKLLEQALRGERIEFPGELDNSRRVGRALTRELGARRS